MQGKKYIYFLNLKIRHL